MRWLIRFALVAAVLMCVWGCATASKSRDFEPSSAAEPPSGTDLQADPVKAADPAKVKDHAKKDDTKIDVENKPLPVLPADPPPPAGTEDLGDDNWGRDQRALKLRDKDRDKVKGSDPEDDAWGKD